MKSNQSHPTKNGSKNDSAWCVVETQPEVPEWRRLVRTGLTKAEAREYAKNQNNGPSGRAGYVYEAEHEADQKNKQAKMLYVKQFFELNERSSIYQMVEIGSECSEQRDVVDYAKRT